MFFTAIARVVPTCCVQWMTIRYVILSKLWKHNAIRMPPLALPCQPYSVTSKPSEICCLKCLSLKWFGSALKHFNFFCCIRRKDAYQSIPFIFLKWRLYYFWKDNYIFCPKEFQTRRPLQPDELEKLPHPSY